jgi:chitin synthase
MAGDIQETWPVSEVSVLNLTMAGRKLSCLQIVYTAIVGLVMLAALLEWFLWIAAFLYCLWKVFVKAEHWTVRVLAVLVGIAFTLLRYVRPSSRMSNDRDG